MTDGLFKNFRSLGRLLATLPLQLYRRADGGLILVDGDQARPIASAKELAPLLIDNVNITITKNGNYYGERLSQAVLNDMLRSRAFIGNFKLVKNVVTSPAVLADHTPSQPGYNLLGSILHLGLPASTAEGLDTINRFCDVMEWASNADRTNAIAALLTVPFRLLFPGGKPFILVTATKSHSGKGTVIDFIIGETAKAELLYEDKDWPMQRSLHDQLLQTPEIGVINFDNVRTDSSGRGKLIRTGFVESFVTTAELVLSSTRNKPIRVANKFIVLLNTNEGSLSIDLLNRALPIRLAPTGDVTERRSPIGNPKLEFLPAHRCQIEAERWGMIRRWVEAGKPLDDSVAHYPMSVWAKTIGGILKVNGFKDFLGNFSTTRAAADPIREAIGILAFRVAGKPLRAGSLATRVIAEGLDKTLLPGVNPANTAACERQIGVMLRPYVGETFTARTATEQIRYRLKKEQGRWEESFPHFRYTFEEIGREPLADEPQGLVLEEKPAVSNYTQSWQEMEGFHVETEPV